MFGLGRGGRGQALLDALNHPVRKPGIQSEGGGGGGGGGGQPKEPQVPGNTDTEI